MKKYYQITKIGNSLFATLPKTLVRQLDLKSGDVVEYETPNDKATLILHIKHIKQKTKIRDLLKSLNDVDREWLENNSRGITSLDK